MPKHSPRRAFIPDLGSYRIGHDDGTYNEKQRIIAHVEQELADDTYMMSGALADLLEWLRGEQ